MVTHHSAILPLRVQFRSSSVKVILE